jgi:hypothetical protein
MRLIDTSLTVPQGCDPRGRARTEEYDSLAAGSSLSGGNDAVSKEE